MSVCLCVYDIYNKTFEGENLHDFHKFSLAENVLPPKIFLLHNLNNKIGGRGQTAKGIPLNVLSYMVCINQG